MARYWTEQGEVLLSVQLILTREAQRGGLPLGRPVRGETMPTTLRPVRPSPAPPATAPRRDPIPAATPALVDSSTGARSAHALRRDLMLERASPTSKGRGVSVTALQIRELPQLRATMGDEAAELVLRGVVDAAPFVLGSSDRIYLTGADEFVLVHRNPRAAERARVQLEAALDRLLQGRGFPVIQLAIRAVDPGALLSA